MFAEDISPAVLVVVIVPAILVLAIFVSMAMAASRRTGRPLQTELIRRLGPITVAVLLTVMVSLLTNRNSPLPLIVGAAVLVVLRLFLFWRRRKPHEVSQTEVKDIPPSSPRPAAPFSPLSLPFLVGAWFLFLFVLVYFCAQYLQSPWTSGTWILAGASVLCLVLIPVQIIRYFRGKQR